MMMGDDFSFSDASVFFENSDAMIRYYNANDGKKNNIELIYSTPTMYVDAVKRADIVWPTRSPQDMMPYKDYQATYWTGYFTSRP
jgi:alpha-mannosidase